MPLSKVGIDLDAINNISIPDFNISSNVSKFISDIPDKANNYTGNWVGIGIMLTLILYLYYKLADRSAVADFGYSQLRSIGLATGITGLIGFVMYAIGYFRELYPIILFIVIFMIAFIWVFKEERS